VICTLQQQKKGMQLKLIFGGEIRRISVPEPQLTVVHLKTKIELLFNLKSDSFNITYKDEEDDMVLISIDEELQEAIRQIVDKKGMMLRVWINPTIPNPTFNTPPQPIQIEQSENQVVSTEEFQRLQSRAFILGQSENVNDLNEAKKVFQRLVKMTPNKWIHYNMAIVEAKLGNNIGAIGALHRAINMGYSDLNQIENNACFKRLHHLADFQSAINTLKKHIDWVPDLPTVIPQPQGTVPNPQAVIPQPIPHKLPTLDPALYPAVQTLKDMGYMESEALYELAVKFKGDVPAIVDFLS